MYILGCDVGNIDRSLSTHKKDINMAELKKSLNMFQLLAFGVAGVVGTSWIYTNSKLFAEYGAGAYLIAFLGLLTSFLGLFVASSRIMVAMGRAHLLPPRLGDIDQRTGTPR